MVPKELRELRAWPGFPAGALDVVFHFLFGQVRHVCPEAFLGLRDIGVLSVDSMVLADQ